jgi:L-seryl-tRNA(Ser) seleniumtransferase
MIARIKKNPLIRAMRIDKFTLAALEATLRLYFDPETAMVRVPTLAMIAADYRSLRRRAARLKRILDAAAGEAVEIGLKDGFSQIGGGALPGEDLPTRLVALVPRKTSVNEFEEWLRQRPTPILGRIENDALVLDVRTMRDDDFEPTGQALREFGGGSSV